MQSDDVFRRNIEGAKDALKAWALANKDVASISLRDTPAFFDLTAEPLTPGACPFGIVLRQDQRYDLSIAGEVFTDRKIEDLALFKNLTEAIAAGRASQIVAVSTLTGLPQRIETRVALPAGAVWSSARQIMVSPVKDMAGIEENHVRAFLPFRLRSQ
jgi:hypothetical protein